MLFVGVVLAGCSGSVSIGSSDQLDTAKLENTLTEASQNAFPAFSVGNAQCPDDVKLEAGGTFTCTVDVEGQPLRFDVTQDDEKGNVSYVKAQAALDTVKLEASLTGQIKEQTGVDVTVACPGDKVLVKDVGATFPCDATAADGTTTVVTVTVDDLDGNISFST